MQSEEKESATVYLECEMLLVAAVEDLQQSTAISLGIVEDDNYNQNR